MNTDIVYWHMKNGQKISVDDMDINHLRNTLKLIIRRAQKPVKIKSRINESAEQFNLSQGGEDNDEPYAFDYLWD